MDNNWLEHYRILHKLIERDFPERLPQDRNKTHPTHWIDNSRMNMVCLWCLKEFWNPPEHCRKHLEELCLLEFL